MKMTPDEAAEQIDAIRQALKEKLTAMSPRERRDLRNRTKTSPELIQSSLTAIGMSDKISAGVGKNADQFADLMLENSRWGLLEGQLRTFLNEVTSARLARSQQLDQIARQTFGLMKQLVLTPGNEDLIPQFEAMQQLRKIERRKKRRPSAAAEGEPPAEP
jgi:hypothetical protein